jgi:hypothetical protein
METQPSIDKLNSFLRGEMAAVETYNSAIGKIDHICTVRDELLVNLKSHQDRVMMLQDAILELDGEPAEEPWGAGDEMFGDRAAVEALEESENLELADYNGNLDDLLDRERQLVSDRLMPAQQRTYDRLSELKNRLSDV